MKVGGSRHDLGNQAGLGFGGIQHVVGFLGIDGHACLAQHVLVFFQGRQGQGPVHVGPRADADGVYAVFSQQYAPVVVHRWNVELVGHFLPRLSGAVGHGDNVYTVNFLKAGYVAVAAVEARSDNANLDSAASHGRPPC